MLREQHEHHYIILFIYRVWIHQENSNMYVLSDCEWSTAVRWWGWWGWVYFFFHCSFFLYYFSGSITNHSPYIRKVYLSQISSVLSLVWSVEIKGFVALYVDFRTESQFCTVHLHYIRCRVVVGKHLNVKQLSL